MLQARRVTRMNAQLPKDCWHQADGCSLERSGDQVMRAAEQSNESDQNFDN